MWQGCAHFQDTELDESEFSFTYHTILLSVAGEIVALVAKQIISEKKVSEVLRNVKQEAFFPVTICTCRRQAV